MGVWAPLKFHSLQLWRFRPALLAALLISSALLVISTGSYLVNTHRLTGAQGALAPPSRIPVQASAGSPAAVKPLALPPFDSVILVSAIEQASVSMKVSTDELTFALEEGAGQPYRRHRASFTALGRYPQIRAAIASILREVPYSSLDSMKCMRNDIGELDVSCSVTLSAFYRRAPSR